MLKDKQKFTHFTIGEPSMAELITNYLSFQRWIIPVAMFLLRS